MCRQLISMMMAVALIAPVDAIAAASKSPKLAKCDGKQRRPGNPYGSILPTVDPQAGTSTPAAQSSERSGVDVFSDTAPAPTPAAKSDAKPAQIPPIGSVILPTSYRSC